jgi:hypothetical protein
MALPRTETILPPKSGKTPVLASCESPSAPERIWNRNWNPRSQILIRKHNVFSIVYRIASFVPLFQSAIYLCRAAMVRTISGLPVCGLPGQIGDDAAMASHLLCYSVNMLRVKVFAGAMNASFSLTAKRFFGTMDAIKL